MRLLRERATERRREREALRRAVRARLRQLLPRFFAGETVWLFGSVTVTGAFHRNSDIDLGIDRLPAETTQYGLTAILEARHLLRSQKEEGKRKKEELNFQDRLRLKIFFAAPAMFLYLLFARGLILDGWPGWYYVFQRTIAEMLLSLRLLTEREGLETQIAR